MPQKVPSKRALPIIRLFVSSTFSDLKHERNALHALVWPELERYCQQRGFTFQAIDLRWGVPTEAGLDHRTMRICFEELRRSQETSPEPNFLILLGNRYGWRPLPEVISVAEFERLKTAAQQIQGEPPDPARKPTESQVELLKQAVAVLEDWYLLDENAKPFGDPNPAGEYVLRTRKPLLHGVDYGKYLDANDKRQDTPEWINVQFVLWSIVNLAFPAAGLGDRFAPDMKGKKGHDPSIVRFQASATEQEIWQGALQVDPQHAKEHIIAWFREIENLNDYPPGPQLKDFVDLKEDGTPDQGSKQALEQLTGELKRNLNGENIFESKCGWRVQQEGPSVPDVTTKHLDAMCEQIRERFQAMIILQINAYWGCDLKADDASLAQVRGSQQELDLECADHLRFAGERAPEKTFVGRQPELQRIRDYLHSQTNQPFVVHGPSGSGKTALLARAAQEVAKLPICFDHKPIVRFIGTTPRSSDLRTLLTSLCQELRQRNPIRDALPTDINELIAEFRSHLHMEAATREHPLILFLDALDQLSDSDSGPRLHWIPRDPLPPHVRLIVSCLSDRDAEDLAGQPYAALQRRNLPAENILSLDELDQDDAQTLLFEKWLKAGGRTVLKDSEQRRLIESRLRLAPCRQPLYLKLLFEEVKLWRSYDENVSLNEPDKPQEYVAALLKQLFVRLSLNVNHGELLVNSALGYLAAARRGLSENEILEVLFADDPGYMTELKAASQQNNHTLPTEPPRIPIAIWSRLRSDLAPYLTVRSAPGGNVVNFYHRQVADFVRMRLLDGEQKAIERHQGLARYFKSIADPSGDRSWSSQSIRGFDELPYQLASSQSQSQLVLLLGDAVFAAAKARMGATFDLLSDYEVAASRAKRHDVWRPRLLQLKQIVRREAERLNRYPECSLQQILLGIAALASPDTGLRSQAEKLTEAHHGSDALKVWSLVPEHRVRLVTQAPARSDLTLENICATQTGVLFRYKGGTWAEYSKDFERIRGGVMSAAYCSHIARGGEAIVFASAGTAMVWNPLPTAAAKFCQLGEPIAAVACSGNGCLLALGGAGGSLQVRDLRNLEATPLLCGSLEGPIKAVWFPSDESVTVVTDGGVLAHAVGGDAWKLFKQLATGQDCRLACSAGGDSACLAGEGNLLRCYDGDGGPRWESNLPAKPHSLAFCSGNNGNAASILVGLEDGTLQEIDAQVGMTLHLSKVSERALQSVEWHPAAAAVLCSDSTGSVFFLSRSCPDEVEFRAWPDCQRILAVQWNESAHCLETLSPGGERYVIRKSTSDGSGDWKASALHALDGPIDDAWILHNGQIVALHRGHGKYSDESQIWYHRPFGSDQIGSRCLWRGSSFFNTGGPSFIDSMAVSRCGTHYAAASMFLGEKRAAFRHGKLSRFSFGQKWQFRERFVDELVLSDRGEVIVITQARGSSGDRLPARILCCRGNTHVLLDDGWGGGIAGAERGSARALFGTAISRNGCTIAAIDTHHALWLFSFNPNRPKIPPRGSSRLQGVVTCCLSDSGTLCATLQTDQTISIFQIDDRTNFKQLAVILPPGQPSCFQFSPSGRHLIVAGQDFIQAISF